MPNYKWGEANIEKFGQRLNFLKKSIHFEKSICTQAGILYKCPNFIHTEDRHWIT